MSRAVKGLLVSTLLLLCTPLILADEAAKTGEALAKAVRDNIEAEDSLEADKKPVKAQVVKQDAPVLIESGTGDISTTGDCAEEVDSSCAAIQPGEGRLAKCMSDQLLEEEKPGYGGKRTGEKCKVALENFRISRSKNINSDLPLAKACKADAEKFCATRVKGESLLGCLRSHREEVQAACAEQVLNRQIDSAADWQLDVELASACKADVASHCAGVSPLGAGVQDCLRRQRLRLAWPCQEQLFRQDVEDASDLRLSTRLFRACLADKKKFCPDVAPGNTRAKECLEDHRNDEGFSQGCRTELEQMIQARAADFRLDPKLRTLCKADIEESCAMEKGQLEAKAGTDAVVILCLQDFREELQSPACAARVAKTMEYAFSDIRFDTPLADMCAEDRMSFCSNVAFGSARVIRCLQDKRQDLNADCKAQLFLEEERMAESVDFQYPLKKACNADLTKFCAQVKHSHAKAIRCLQDNKDHSGFSPLCAAEVQKHVEFSVQDYRLNYRLKTACHDTVLDKCASACPSSRLEDDQPCGGTVLRCLTDKLDEITNEDCKNEVTYLVKMEVKDFRNDVLLAEACRKDVETVCSSVLPGEGRVHKCLRENREKLSEACRNEEMRLERLQSGNMELMPNLAAACRSERARLCAGVRPGKARVFNCLLSHAEREVNFGVSCFAQLAAQQARRLRDWRLDYDLRTTCKDDVPKYCANGVLPAGRNASGVLQCLVDKADTVSGNCAQETGRAVRDALQFYAIGQPVTTVCDEDIASHCRPSLPGQSQQVRKCLAGKANPRGGGTPQGAGDLPESVQTEEQKATGSGSRRLLDAPPGDLAGDFKKTAPLSPACAALVALAEPRDAYNYFNTAMSAAALATQMQSLEQRLGLKAGTLSNSQTGFLTLTGWSAVVGIIALILAFVGAATLIYRRYKGYDQMSTYTLVSKQQQGRA